MGQLLVFFSIFCRCILLCTKVGAKVGFEFEISKVSITNTKYPLRPISPRVVVYQAPSKLWNLTTDSTSFEYVYLELVTAPFDFFTSNNGMDALGKCTTEVAEFFDLLSKKRLEALAVNSTKLSLPGYISEEYQLSFLPNYAILSPQVTFGILPSHFHMLACDQAFNDDTLLEGRISNSFFLKPQAERKLMDVCTILHRFFKSKHFFKMEIQIRNDPTLKSFLALFALYVAEKSKQCLSYPKLISGVFLSRVSFAEIFQELPIPIKMAIIKNDLLRQLTLSIRSSAPSCKLFPHGYIAEFEEFDGPTVDEWIEGFTRVKSPVDLLSKLDIDKSMGSMHMDSTSCGEDKCVKHWIIENRGLPHTTTSQLPKFMESLFLYISQFNLRKVKEQ